MARRLPVLETTGAIRTDGSRRVIHPADVHGRFNTARKSLFYVLVAIMLSLPWIKINGNPAVLLDIPARRFFLFGSTFNAQDGAMLFFVLISIAWTLVTVTAVAGRMWCGWTCPQTVFLEGLFRPIERLVLGPASKRIAQDAEPNPPVTLLIKKVIVHILWFVAAALVAHAVVSFFVPPAQLARFIPKGPSSAPTTFLWSAAFTGVIYFNFAWFREQTCLIVCPYGRLQSVLTDKDSLTVGYDVKRGEPRGKATEKAKNPTAVGDCVDCKRCIVVCPTGIDIRNGAQFDCIGCTACIDACDEVMEKLDRPKGLIRYDSLNGLHGEQKRLLRGRVYFYAAIGVALATVGAVSFRNRKDFAANVLRVQGPPYTLEGATVRNAFELHVVNKRAETAVYLVEPIAKPNVQFIVPLTRISLAAFADARAPVFVISQRGNPAGDFTAQLRVRREGAPEKETLTVNAPCLAPMR